MAAAIPFFWKFLVLQTSYGDNDIYKRLKPYLTTAKVNAIKTGSFNLDVLKKGLSEMQKIFEDLGI